MGKSYKFFKKDNISGIEKKSNDLVMFAGGSKLKKNATKKLSDHIMK